VADVFEPLTIAHQDCERALSAFFAQLLVELGLARGVGVPGNERSPSGVFLVEAQELREPLTDVTLSWLSPSFVGLSPSGNTTARS
jgi:hypothetical protein